MKPTSEHRKHWERVRGLGCIVTGSKTDVTIHHCHGGSMSDAGFRSGMAQRGASHWLVIPLVAQLHSTGSDAIDGGIGVRTWEEKHGKQTDLLDEVGRRLKVNIWELGK